MTEQRIFTIEEVDALIPALSELLGRQFVAQKEIEGRLSELARLTGSLPPSLEPVPDDASEVERVKRDLRERIKSYEDGWQAVQALGAVVKDPQIGLLDFYGRIEGRLVWLCWRYGEASLGFYHELEAGYGGRRPLGPETRERLLN